MVANASPKYRIASKKDMNEAIQRWKTSTYKHVGHIRGGKTQLHQDGVNALQINWYMANYMRTKALRAPTMPPGIERPNILYRGMSSRTAMNFKRDGYVDLKNYVSFSRNKEVANIFAAANPYFDEEVVVKLRVSNIPAGTPWIWYYHKNTKPRSKNFKYPNKVKLAHLHSEEEVLLPPGRLTRIGNHTRTQYEVVYTPDIHAVSVLSKRKIIARLGSGRLNSADAPLQPYQETWRLFQDIASSQSRSQRPRTLPVRSPRSLQRASSSRSRSPQRASSKSGSSRPRSPPKR